MARNAFVVVGEDVVGEEELRITAAARTERHYKKSSFLAEICSKLVRDQFQLCPIGAGILQTFHLLVDLFGFGGGLANLPNVRPCGIARYHSQVPDDWDPLARHGLNQPWTAGAIDRTGT